MRGMRPKATVQRVLGYARVSSEPQTRGESLALQQQAIAAHVAALGLKLDPRLYVEAESGVGEKEEKRVRMQALMKDARAGDLVLVDKVDRWSRDPEYTYRSMRELLKVKGCSVYFIAEGIDPSTPEGDRQLDMRIIFAKWEHARIKERLCGERAKLRERGYHAEGTPPPGYRRKRTATSAREEKLSATERLEVYELVVVEKEAEFIRSIFAACIRGDSIERIAKTHKVGKNFVRYALGRKFYTGVIRAPEGGEWIKGRHPAIIDPTTFARAQRALEKRQLGGPRPRGHRGFTDTWWLRDLACCGKCGARMTSAWAGPVEKRRYYYACTARTRPGKGRERCDAPYVPVKLVEQDEEHAVIGRLHALRSELSAPQKRVDVPPPKSLEAQRATLAKKRDRYVEMYSDGAITKAQLSTKLADVDAKLLQLDAETPAPTPVMDEKARRKLRTDIIALYQHWGKLAPQRKRTVINLLATACYIAADWKSPARELSASEAAATPDGQVPGFRWRAPEDLAVADVAAALTDR